MSAGYDLIVVGAGHNGLTTATLLAKKGRKVLVLERRDTAGGLAAPVEFHPGYRSAGLFDDSSGVRAWAVDALGLADHGLVSRREAPDLLALGNGEGTLLLAGNPDRAAEEIAKRSTADGSAYGRFLEFNDGLRSVLRDFLDRPPVDLIRLESASLPDLLRRGLRLRMLGRERMMELLRLPPTSVTDWLGEWFEDQLLKAALAFPAISGGYAGPRSPGTTANLLMHRAAAGPGCVGGGAALVAALEKAAAAAGVEIRTGSNVKQILTDAEGVTGVLLDSEETITSRQVAASCDPRQTFLRLLRPGATEASLVRHVGNYRSRGTTAQLLIALDGPLLFDRGPEEPVEFACTGARLDDLEQAFDAVKYRRASTAPVLSIHQPTVSSPGLAPAGHAVVQLLIHFAPHAADRGWGREHCRELEQAVLEQLERHTPQARPNIVATRLISPADLEEAYGLTGGQIHHGEHALDQLLVRPVPGCSGYRTPLPGLFLCGSGSHPGGGLTCVPGSLAAAAIAG